MSGQQSLTSGSGITAVNAGTNITSTPSGSTVTVSTVGNPVFATSIQAPYFTAGQTPIPLTGAIRLANNAPNTDSVSWRNAANTNEFGLYLDGSDRIVLDSTAYFQINGGSIQNGSNGVQIDCPTNSAKTGLSGLYVNLTGNGANATTYFGGNFYSNPTGSLTTTRNCGIIVEARCATTGTSLGAGTGNFGIQSIADGVSDFTIPLLGQTSGNTMTGTAIGVCGDTTLTTSSTATMIGVVGLALNSGSSGKYIGGYFALRVNTTPSYPASNVALVCDNGSASADVFYAMVNGTTKFKVDQNANIITGSGALATNATNGFLYPSNSAGAPSGTPAVSGNPIHVDSTNNVLYFYSGAAWNKVDFFMTALAGNTTAANKVMYLLDTSSARTITLPAASANFQFIIKDKTGNANANNITIARAASESIEGIAANKTLQTNWGYWWFVCDGTNWFILS